MILIKEIIFVVSFSSVFSKLHNTDRTSLIDATVDILVNDFGIHTSNVFLYLSCRHKQFLGRQADIVDAVMSRTSSELTYVVEDGVKIKDQFEDRYFNIMFVDSYEGFV